MKALLDDLIPRLVPGWIEGENFKCVPHEGKSDLDRSIPRKLSSWRIPGDRFIIVRDSDGEDPAKLRARFQALGKKSGRPETLVRLAVQELESWYLGDLEAVAAAFDVNVNTAAHRKRFSRPDDWQKPSVEIKRIVPAFQKVGGARLMAPHLKLEGNTSSSFNDFADGLARVAKALER